MIDNKPVLVSRLLETPIQVGRWMKDPCENRKTLKVRDASGYLLGTYKSGLHFYYTELGEGYLYLSDKVTLRVKARNTYAMDRTSQAVATSLHHKFANCDAAAISLLEMLRVVVETSTDMAKRKRKRAIVKLAHAVDHLMFDLKFS
jgi:hypothetical protein